MLSSYSLHKIVNPYQFGFSPEDYSRFKFGDDGIAKAFGISLAEGFIRDVLSTAIVTEQIVVVSSPYSFIPTATFAMKNHFVFRLNRWLADHDLPVVQETKVHRTITYKEDYGELNAAERLQLIGSDSFHIDQAFLQGKTAFFLDDIKITGSHERMILKMVREYGLMGDIHMLYFAELVNPELPPQLENYLNYYAVKNIFDLDSIIRGEAFVLNTRIVKYILGYDFEAFCIFIGNQEDNFVGYVYDMALGNAYHTIEAYQRNLTFIREHLHHPQTVNK
jgi:hypothetical protein